MEDVIPLCIMLQHIELADVICQVADGIATYCYYYSVMADVIAQWQMEWPLQGGSDLSPGRCYSQGADGCSWVYLF